MKRIDCEQGSVEWFSARLGIVTASRLKDLTATLKNGKSSASRQDYILELVSERLTHQVAQHYQNAAMAWGSENEQHARAAYEAETGELVEAVGFCRHDSLPFGASPDGFVNHEGAIEIKCPYDSKVSLRTRLEGMPAEHQPQIQGLLLVSGRAWCDFVSFDPRLPPHMRLYVQRITPSQEWFKKIEAAVLAAEDDIKAIMEKLNA